ncbi:ribose-5-phosphate isomerase A [Streptococcus sp.]|uniref:ribose-5-phosphate isomerase A n=1 Tax=Streptococcus sp. TaxID=1306 RepID=UPI00391D5954
MLPPPVEQLPRPNPARSTTKSIDAEVDYVDLTVDGADEVDGNFNGIKGGGGARSWKRW